ncbi:unnamed protein product [Schistosoma margrebowiei]|uniref:Uncharacterized protein n=1 Tax=Schistosoma margrebowiei TaxID=48269 RepID=A0A183N5Y3_9TREM|nr:unnamed protein product [Schistosoma margrebowiei]
MLISNFNQSTISHDRSSLSSMTNCFQTDTVDKNNDTTTTINNNNNNNNNNEYCLTRKGCKYITIRFYLKHATICIH